MTIILIVIGAFGTVTKMTLILIIIDALGTISKGLIRGLENRKTNRDHPNYSTTARILRKVLET